MSSLFYIRRNFVFLNPFKSVPFNPTLRLNISTAYNLNNQFSLKWARTYSSQKNTDSQSSFWEDGSTCPSTWIKNFYRENIPHKTFQLSFSRSGGPGGQNVNKATAKWLPLYIRCKLKEVSNRANKNGEYVITSSRNRTQMANVEDCIEKIYEDICKAASTIPNPTDPSQKKRVENLIKASNAQKKTRKVFHSNKKASRRKFSDD